MPIKTSPKKKAKVQPIRPRDLLKPATHPIHPFDQIHDTDTSGLVPARDLATGHPNDEHVTAYYGVAPSILRSLIDRWRETSPPHHITDYTFLDIGAGKGRAVLLASEFPFRQIIGVELNPAMATIAQSNADIWHRAHAADPTAIIDHRIDSTVAPQALFLMNHPFTTARAKKLATQSATAPDRIMWLYQTLFSRPPTNEETQLAQSYITQHPQNGWEQYCHALLCSNELFYVD